MRQMVLVLVVCLSVGSCSTRKDRAVNRVYHQTTTKFNVLFNGQEAIAAGIEAEIASHQPNYWEQLPVDPFPLVDLFTLNPKENANFSRAEEKAVIAIQKHSMPFGNEQKNQQIDEAYLLLGKARYYNGRYLQALDAFDYIIDQLPNASSVNQAQLWKAKVLIQLLQEQRAIAIFEKLFASAEMSPSEAATAAAYLAKAQLALNQPQQATQSLAIAAALTKDKTLRARYSYLQGQLYDQLEQPDKAAMAYQAIIDMNRRIPRTYWIHAKLNQLNTSQLDERSLQKQYAKLTNNEENKQYLDKIYLSHARYSLSIQDTIATKALIEASLRTHTTDNTLKGIAYQTMGDIFFKQNEFLLAGAYLDSTLQVLPPKTRAFRKIKRKREKLNDIIAYETTRQKADSLLILMDKSPEEQRLVFENHIKALQKADALQSSNQESQQLTSNNSFLEDDFYFYNRELRARGEREFFRIWGNIKKTDNWRYAGLQSVDMLVQDNEENLMDAEETTDPRYLVETYLQQLPAPEKRDSLIQVRNRAYFQAGLAYKEQFEVYPKAKNRLLTLLSLDTKYNLPSLYHLYQIELATDGDQAAGYKHRIISEYPSSQYAMILQNPEAMEDARQRFEEQYHVLKERFRSQAFEEVIEGCFTAILSTQDESLRARFALLRAHAIGRLDGLEAYQNALSEVALTFPQQTAGKDASKRLLEIQEITPTLAEDGDHYLIYFVFDREDHATTTTIQNKLTKTILSQGLQRSVRATIDIFDRNTEFLVVQRFTSEGQAIDYRDDLLRRHPELRTIKNFVDLTSGLRDVLIFKNLTDQ